MKKMSELDISIETPCCKGCDSIIEEFWQYLKKELSSLLPKRFLIEISIVDNEEIRSLNRDYRNKDYVTDVLSFEDGDVLPDGAVFLGSIVIACERAKEQAEEIGNSFEEELRFLFMHGILHILGFDHETDNGEMFRLQRELKKKLKQFFSHSED